MPIYEYECEKCGHRLEKIQKFSDPLVGKCPKCKGKLRRLLSAPAIQFKGSGWYITDYARKGSPSSEEKSDKGTAEKSGKGKEDKPGSDKPAKPDKSSRKDSSD